MHIDRFTPQLETLTSYVGNQQFVRTEPGFKESTLSRQALHLEVCNLLHIGDSEPNPFAQGDSLAAYPLWFSRHPAVSEASRISHGGE